MTIEEVNAWIARLPRRPGGGTGGRQYPELVELDSRIVELDARRMALVADVEAARVAWSDDVAGGGDGVELAEACRGLEARVSDMVAVLTQLRGWRAEVLGRIGRAQAAEAAERAAAARRAARAALPGVVEAFHRAVGEAAGVVADAATRVVAARAELDAAHAAAGVDLAPVGQAMVERSRSHGRVWGSSGRSPADTAVALAALVADPHTLDPVVELARTRAAIDGQRRQREVALATQIAEAEAARAREVEAAERRLAVQREAAQRKLAERLVVERGDRVAVG
jgi:hypothetical protein